MRQVAAEVASARETVAAAAQREAEARTEEVAPTPPGP